MRGCVNLAFVTYHMLDFTREDFHILQSGEIQSPRGLRNLTVQGML